ncbi:MAG: hypothetical protein K2M86_02015, partial [Odoribacter sp.]|nr:hypothetical protein [Odoribacter sp.]
PLPVDLPSPIPELKKQSPRTAQAPVFKPVKPLSASYPLTEFDFYGMTVSLPELSVALPDSLNEPADYAAAWLSIDKSDVKSTLIPALEAKAKEFSLNDYLKYELASSYIANATKLYGNASMSLLHYILANMNYDARIGVNEYGEAVLLLPFEQDMVYGRTYLQINGQNYFTFQNKQASTNKPASMKLATCELPENSNPGSKFNLRIDSLTLPYTPQPYKLSGAGLEVSGELNGNILKLLYHYPQMPMGEYARSNILHQTRKEIVEQLKKQLEDQPQLEAVNTLLHFVQEAFEYATDSASHGFEKPYFFEETLYYPTCDCEDRSIFYTYLLWNVLGVENQLLSFPGHESVSVNLNDSIEGDSYEYKGKTFYISDPTYMGAQSGMCMPQYKTIAPKIDYTYAP